MSPPPDPEEAKPVHGASVDERTVGTRSYMLSEGNTGHDMHQTCSSTLVSLRLPGCHVLLLVKIGHSVLKGC